MQQTVKVQHKGCSIVNYFADGISIEGAIQIVGRPHLLGECKNVATSGVAAELAVVEVVGRVCIAIEADSCN